MCTPIGVVTAVAILTDAETYSVRYVQASSSVYVWCLFSFQAGTVLTDPGYLYTDEDPGDTHKFTMTCGLNVGYFSIAPTTGRINLATNIDVDAAGLATNYTCAVTISDGSLTDTASLVIYVNNINDNTPSFATNFFTSYVGINTAINTVIGSVVATDGDTGAFGMNF